MTDKPIINHGIPTNIITGFLGVGKTSSILHLLKNKPKSERWAVLVNEFGEIGIDGSLYSGQHSEEHGVFIREVAGGCMCCASGLPMQMTLNILIARAKPDRLLIEPTGLGHPKEVLQTLSDASYRKLLSLQKTLTLVDARKLNDSRYTQHETFNQQIAVADCVIGNKLDLYHSDDKEHLIRYVEQNGQPHTDVVFSQYGHIDISLLQGLTQTITPRSAHHHSTPSKRLISDIPMPSSGVLKAENEGEGFRSIGWRFSPDKVFNRSKLFSLLSGLQLERMKAVFITQQGVFGYNLTEDALTEIELDDCMESRIEIISDTLCDDIESQLTACLEAK